MLISCPFFSNADNCIHICRFLLRKNMHAIPVLWCKQGLNSCFGLFFLLCPCRMHAEKLTSTPWCERSWRTFKLNLISSKKKILSLNLPMPLSPHTRNSLSKQITTIGRFSQPTAGWSGWGVVSQSLTVQGTWSREETKLPNNTLELWVVRVSLLHWTLPFQKETLKIGCISTMLPQWHIPNIKKSIQSFSALNGTNPIFFIMDRNKVYTTLPCFQTQKSFRSGMRYFSYPLGLGKPT